jgi:hypothetical protein
MLSNSALRMTIPRWNMPLTGGKRCVISWKAFSSWNTSPMSHLSTIAVAPACCRRLTRSMAAGFVAPLRERKTRCLAPASTSLTARARPIPPIPPTRTYVAFPRSTVRGASLGITCIYKSATNSSMDLLGVYLGVFPFLCHYNELADMLSALHCAECLSYLT